MPSVPDKDVRCGIGRGPTVMDRVAPADLLLPKQILPSDLNRLLSTIYDSTIYQQGVETC